MLLEISLLSLATILLFVYRLVCWSNKHFSYNLDLIPKATPCLPYFGNALHLDINKCHLVLADWAKKYGPVFYIKLFQEDIIVLNDYASIHDALVVKCKDFAGRPPMYRTTNADRHMHSIVWQTYTDKLVFLRKEVLKSLRMYGTGLERLEVRCQPEIQDMLQRLTDTKGQPTNPWNIVFDAVCNVMLCFTLGTRLDPNSSNYHRIKEVSSMFNDTFGAGQARKIDLVPLLRLLRNDSYCQLHRALQLRDQFWEEELAKLHDSKEEMDCVVQHLLRLLNGQGKTRINSTASEGKSVQLTSELTSSPTEDIQQQQLDLSITTIKEVFTNLILAGSDTTATALTCLLLTLIHHPNIQHQLWLEVQAKVGEHCLPSLADREQMPYFEATLLELLRYISHIPLAVPHYTTCDTSVLGKSVPVNTTVYINLWSLHHDESVWPDPWTFNPNRFLDADGNLLPPNHDNRRKFLPFGAGRRVCLGETLAKNRLFLFAAALVQNFYFEAEDKENLPEIDPRTYKMGLVLHPKPFKLRAIPRGHP